MRDFSRYIIAWKLCSTMKAEDVTATLNVALKASGLDQAKVIHRPRLLSDNGSSYISSDLSNDTPPYPFMPSPTFGLSSSKVGKGWRLCHSLGGLRTFGEALSITAARLSTISYNDP